MNEYNYLRALLKSKNIKVKELSNKIGISQRTLNQKINGEVKFLDRDIEIILSELKMSYEDVFRTKDIKYIDIDLQGKKYYISEDAVNKIKRIIDKEAI
jgi:transcriptional regulator with XRE-family HTH domain